MGIYEAKDRRGKVQIYVDKRWPDGKRFKRIQPNKTIAKKTLARINEAIAMGTWRQLREDFSRPRTEGMTIEQLSSSYLEHCEVVNRRPDFKRQAVTAINQVVGNRVVAEFTRADAQHFARVRARKVRPATINRGLAVLKNMLNFAVDQGFIDSNPLVRFKMLPEPQKIMRVMSIAQYRSLVESVSNYDVTVAAYCALLGETGMRKAEGLRLQWSDISGDLVTVGKSKSGKIRHIPLSEYAQVWLSELFRIVGVPWVFLKSNGQRWKDPRGPFLRGREDVGLKWVGFHDLRHFRATQWVRHGMDLRTVQELLGHSSIAVTNRYAHFAPGYAAEKVIDVSKLEESELKRYESGTTEKQESA